VASKRDGARESRAEAKAVRARAKALRPWYRKKRFWLLGIVVAVVATSTTSQGTRHGGAQAVAAGTGNSGTTATTAASTSTTAPTPTTTVPKRTVTGKLTTLGAGNFTVGPDIPAGLYNVTAGAGQSGNFIVTGNDNYDEILGSADELGVPEVRAWLQNGDKIQLSGLSSVTFTPVATPYVTAIEPVDLYAGTWTVGQDIAPGRYVATPGAGQSGNFIINGEGINEILGSADGLGVPSVTVTVHKGDVIQISGLARVVMTPKTG